MIGFVVVLVLIFGLAFWAAMKVARAVQRGVDAANRNAAASKKKHSPYHWVFGSIHYVWMAVIPAARYIYRAWHTAPPGSIEKVFWGAVMTAIAALALWLVLKFLDRAINREPKPATEQGTAL